MQSLIYINYLRLWDARPWNEQLYKGKIQSLYQTSSSEEISRLIYMKYSYIY